MSGKAKYWYRMRNAGDTAEIVIYGEIGGFGVTAESFMQEFQSLGNISKLRIRINSDGGDVFAGFAIYNMLSRSLAFKEVVIDGLAASIASVIAMAGDEIVMPKNSMLMIHNPWGIAVGQSEEVISFGEALADMREGIVSAYRDKAPGLSEARIKSLMDKETWLSAQKAVSMGLATRVAQPVQMNAAVLNAARIAKFENVPAAFRASLKESVMAKSKTNQNAREEIFGDDDEDGEDAQATMRGEVVKTAKDIRAMVKLAGRDPELADKFIEDGLSVADVLAKLQEKLDGKNGKSKSKSGDGDGDGDGDGEVSARNAGGGDGDAATLDPKKIWSRFNAFKAVRRQRERSGVVA